MGKSYKPVTTKTSDGISREEVRDQSSSSTSNASEDPISKESFKVEDVIKRSNDLKEKSGKDGERK